MKKSLSKDDDCTFHNCFDHRPAHNIVLQLKFQQILG